MRGDREPARRAKRFVVAPRTAVWALSVLLLVVSVACAPSEETRSGSSSATTSAPPSTTAAATPDTSVRPPGSPTTTGDRLPTRTTTAPDPTRTTAQHPRRFHVAPGGSDEAAGTEDDPWATLSHALGRLRAGDALVVHGGTYRERVRIDAAAGTPDLPILVRAARGEEPVIQGLLWLRRPHHWVIDGINVTWDEERNDDDEHMVKLTDGEGWVLRNSELWGAQSYAALLIAGTEDGGSSDWRVIRNCIHDTVPSNDTNEDQLVYVNTGAETADGVIANNLLFGAPNGSAVKLGGPSEDEGGAHGVTVRHNTILDVAQGVFVAWGSSRNVITRNLFAGTQENYGHIRGFELYGDDNIASDNGGDDHRPFILNDEGYTGVADRGGNSSGLEVDTSDAGCGFLVDTGYGLETALHRMPSS